MPQLKEIVTEENINVLPGKVPNKIFKEDYVKAIFSARHPGVVGDESITVEDTVEEEEEAKDAITLGKKIISAKYNITQLIAFVAKEKIVMPKGCRLVKQDYVDAVYNARK